MMWLDPPPNANPHEEPWSKQIILAGLASGHRGTFELALILAGRKDLMPCKGCDYTPAGCRCEEMPT